MTNLISEEPPSSSLGENGSHTAVPGTRNLWSKFREKEKDHRRQVGLVLLVVTIVVLFLYLSIFSPVKVRSHQLSVGTIIGEVMGTGTLDTRVKVTISSKIVGRLREVLADQGDYVNADQVLARLDDHDFRNQVEVEEANVSARKASVERMLADSNIAKSTLDFASKDYERVRTLIHTKSISQQEYDKTLSIFTSAKANNERAEAALLEGRQQLIVAEKTLEFQKSRLADTTIKAPFDGLIVRRDREAGDVLVPGTSLLMLVSVKEIWINAWVDETRMGWIKSGQPARIVFRSEPSTDYNGNVVRVGRESDPETREFVVDVRLDKLPDFWSIGQRAEVYIQTEAKDKVTALPSKYLVTHAGELGVFIVLQGRSRWRPIKIGVQGQDTVEVIEGVTPGDTVIMPADLKAKPLTDGSRVTELP